MFHRATLSSKPNKLAGAQQIEEANDSVRRSGLVFTNAMFTSVGVGKSLEHSIGVKRALCQVASPRVAAAKPIAAVVDESGPPSNKHIPGGYQPCQIR